MRSAAAVWCARLARAVLVLTVLLGASVARAADPPVVDQTGWWSTTGRLVLVPGLTPPAPPPPNVPPGSIAVSAVSGRTNAVAAVGIMLGVAPGSTVEKLTLTLVPASAQSDSTTPATSIVACPITVFWAGEDNGPLAGAPTSDCTKASVRGVKGSDNRWTFDLTPIAALWVDEDAGLSQNGVLLQPGTDPPGQTFSIAYGTGPAISVALTASEPFESEEPAPSTEGGDFTTEVLSEPAPEPGAGSADLGSLEPVSSPVQEPVSAPEPPPTEAAPPAVEVASRPVSAPGPGTFGGWPLGAFLAVLLAVLGAAVASLTLGLSPDVAVLRREGGLTRALAVRPNQEIR